MAAKQGPVCPEAPDFGWSAMQVDTLGPRPVASEPRVDMRTSPRRWVGAPAVLAGVGFLLGTGIARADEPRNATEPRVMQEPGEVVNVIDAFDDGDPFD